MNIYKHIIKIGTALRQSLWAVPILFLIGCSSKYTVNQDIIQETFLTKCPDTLPYDYGKTGKDWTLMAKEWSSIYHECSIRHNGIVDAIEINK